MKPLYKMTAREAYEFGLRKGREMAAAQAVEQGFQTGLYLALAGYYNTMPDDLLTDEEFGRWSSKAEQECTRIFREIRGDYDVTKYAVVIDKKAETLEDNVHHAVIRLDDLRKRLGMGGL